MLDRLVTNNLECCSRVVIGVFSWGFPGGRDENQTKQDNRCPGGDSSRPPPDYKSRALR